MHLQDNRRVSDKCLNRHWCEKSERFTGVDSLLTMLDQGWKIMSYHMNRAGFTAHQRSTVHVFKLQCKGKTVTMNVIDNPYIEKVIQQQNISLIPTL